MKKLTTIDYLINIFPEDSWPWVISSMRHDRAVWNALNNQDFLNFAFNKLGGQPKLWTPFNLALISIDETINLENHIDFDIKQYPEIFIKSEQTYNDLKEKSPENISLCQAGLLAIYYFQKPELVPQITSGTIYGCIFSLLNDKTAFLNEIDHKLVAHAILSNPIDPAELRTILASVIGYYINSYQYDAIKYFSWLWPELVPLLIAEDIENLSSTYTFFQTGNDDPLITNIGIALNEIKLLDLANQKSALQSRTRVVINYLEEIKSSLLIQLMKALLTEGEFEQAYQIWKNSSVLFHDFQVADFILFLEDSQYAKTIGEWIPEDFINKAISSGDVNQLLATCIYYYHQGDYNSALTLLKKVIGNYELGNFHQQFPLLIVAKLYYRFKKFDESITVLEKVLTAFPNHYDTLSLLLDNYEAKKDFCNEITIARLMVVLFPQDLNIHRKLARSLSNTKQWIDAVSAYEVIIEKQKIPPVEDLYHLAECANMADIPQQAASVCQQILASNPEDHMAHLILGEAYMALGDPQKAQKQFEQAIEISPTSVRAYLGLAHFYEQKNDIEKSKEILLTASQAIPNTPQINLALGNMFLKQNALTKALTLFQTAKENYENRQQNISDDCVYSDILESLGKTQLQLGFHNDAHDTLEYGYSLFPSKVGITHTYAKFLLISDQVERAKQILSDIREQEPENLDIQIDYATACLTGNQDPTDAEESLLYVLEIEPQNFQAKALLAEAYEANDKLDQAYDLYKEVINTPLNLDTYWHIRLSLGMGRVSLAKKDPGTAIAILKNALIGNGEDLRILQSLSNAYLAAELDDKALAVAKSALHLAPNDENNFDWYIDQALKMGATTDAIAILNQSLENKPENPKLLNKLAWLYKSIGNFNAASEIFTKITTLEHINSDELFNASQGFLAVGEPDNAIECIDKAIQLAENTEMESLLVKLILTKSRIQKEQGNLIDALSTIENFGFTKHLPPEIIDIKVRILFELNRFLETKNFIEDGIGYYPSDLHLRLLAVSIYRLIGELDNASIHAKHVLNDLEVDNFKTIDFLTSSILADLFISMLQPNLARELIEHPFVLNGNDSSIGALPYYCLKAELALYSEEEVAAAAALTTAVKIDPNHPRVLALRAQIISRQGDSETAKTIFYQGLQSVRNYSYLNEPRRYPACACQELFDDAASTFISLAEASLMLHEWGVTTYLFQKAIQMTPKEPRSHFSYARAIVLRAEYQQLCNLLGVVTHSPGESSTAEYAYRQFEGAIIKAAQYLIPHVSATKSKQDEGPHQKIKISTWLARGQAVFKPSLDHANAISKLELSPDNQAAYLASLALCGKQKLAAQNALDILVHTVEPHLVNTQLLAQISLSMIEESTDIALKTITKAIDIGARQNNIILPTFYAIQALIAQSQNDKTLELKALQIAINNWSDEPRWLSRAANLLMQGTKEDLPIAIKYLEQASILEPKAVDHSLSLAEAFQKMDQFKAAINILERSAQENSTNASLWLALAQLYYSERDIPQTIRCAKNAILVDKKLIDALFLLVDVSTEVNNPSAALKYIEEILEVDPGNSQALLLEYKSYQALKQKQHALHSLEKVIPFYPESISLQLERVQLIVQIKGFDHALTEIKKLEEKYPNNTQISLLKAEVIANSGDHENTANLARRILTIDKDNLDSTELTKLLYLLGRSLRKSGHLDQAIYHLSEAIRISPHNSLCHVELGRCYQNRRQLEQALHHFEEAIKLEPESAQNYYLAGMTFKESKNYENAEIMFKKAAEIAPMDLKIHRQLAAVTAINIVTNHPDTSMMTIKF